MNCDHAFTNQDRARRDHDVRRGARRDGQGHGGGPRIAYHLQVESGQKPLARFVHALSLSAGLRTSGRSRKANAIETRIPSADKTDGNPQASIP